MQFKNNKAQVWVETAIYTLIGLTIIAILLSAAIPQIDNVKDKGIIRQTTTALNDLHKVLQEIEQSPGNIRIIDFKIAKGRLEIDSANDSLIYTMENTRLELSQPGQEIPEGNVILKTQKLGSRFIITLKIDYSSRLNITYGDDDSKTMTLHAGTSPYKLQLENVGDNDPNDNTHIDFDIL